MTCYVSSGTLNSTNSTVAAFVVQREQVDQHEFMVSRYERELFELRKNPPDRTVQARQLQDFCKLESYVKFEVNKIVIIIIIITIIQ